VAQAILPGNPACSAGNLAGVAARCLLLLYLCVADPRSDFVAIGAKSFH
jgi:hypothetical protein